VTDFLPFLGDVLAGIASTDAAEQRRRFDRLMQVGAQSAWDAARAQVDEELKKELGRSDRIAQGVSLYELDLRLATSVSLARAGGGSSLAGSIPMQLRIGPDLLIAKSTTPTVFGSEFDPKFSVDFGVVIDFDVDVEPERMFLGVRVGSARLTGKEFSGNPYVDSQNLIADLAKFFAGTVSPWFGGPDYVAVVESLLGQHDFAGVLNAALQPVNDLLGELAKEGMGTVMALFPDAAVPGGLSAKAVQLDSGGSSGSAALVVLAQPLAGAGVISGEIRWPSTEGAPELEPPFVGAFTLAASVATGAAVGEFAQPTDVTHLGRFEYANSDGDNVISYVLSGLPTDRPIAVECAANGAIAWSGDAATKIPMVERNGWTGAVTIHPRTAGVFSHPRPGIQRAGHGAEVELNPQPIPPGRGIKASRGGSVLETVALNPQPIPPGRAMRDIQAQTEQAKTGATRIVSRVGALASRIDPTKLIRAASERENPTGIGEVDGINFTVHLVEKPR
jgi:hypothetical protein